METCGDGVSQKIIDWVMKLKILSREVIDVREHLRREASGDGDPVSSPDPRIGADYWMPLDHGPQTFQGLDPSSCPS